MVPVRQFDDMSVNCITRPRQRSPVPARICQSPASALTGKLTVAGMRRCVTVLVFSVQQRQRVMVNNRVLVGPP
jgi:hypothetical protein